MEPAAPARAERGLAAILAADVTGYSRLIEADEEGTLNRLKELRAEVMDPRIAAHRGRTVKTTGDGLLLEFASVVDALRCAAEMQTALAEGNAALPSERRIEFRVGIHQGDIVSTTAISSATESMLPHGSKAWPSRVASASRSACRRMQRAASTSPSKTWDTRR